MKRYFYFMPGRALWFDLAVALEDKSVATPILWLGDDRHIETATQRFPTCTVFRLSLLKYARQPLVDGYDGALSGFFTSPKFHFVKDVALKMMDRVDAVGFFRRIDREAAFWNVCMWAAHMVSEKRPDFLLCGEAPHSHGPYVLYEMCRFAGVRTLIFGQWSIAPVLYIRETIRGRPVPLRSRNPDAGVDGIILRRIQEYVAGIDPASGAIEEPDYMRWQREQERVPDMVERKPTLQDSVVRTRRALTRGARKVLARLGVRNKEGCEIRADERWLQGIVTLGIRSIASSDKKRIKKARLEILKRALDDTASSSGARRYVLFLLHYEPERTTCPDGGVYNDQLNALVDLTDALPKDLTVLVKEHPSQFSSTMKGDLGRSPIFYAAVANMKNVLLVPLESQSDVLMRDCLFVATVSGSAALEAALLERKALIFGHAWYAGCPNVESWGDGFDIESFVQAPIASRSVVIKWLRDLYLSTGVPGFQNPSGSRRFGHYENETNFLRVERAGAFELVQSALTP